MQLLKKKREYVIGKEKKYTYDLYLKLDSGYIIPIKASFKSGYIPLVVSALNLKEGD